MRSFAHFFIEGAATEGVEVGYLSPMIFGAFPEYLTQLLSPFDLLWVALAIMTAWKIPAPAQVSLE